MKKLALALALLGTPAVALEPVCSDNPMMHQNLINIYKGPNYQGWVSAVGMDLEGNLIEIWQTIGDEFVILQLHPNGKICQVTGGVQFEILPQGDRM